MILKKHSSYIIFIFLVTIGGFLRFYKLDWGQGYFFHPDEYHIVGAVNRLINEGYHTNPKLFSYGSFTVYLIYFIHQILQLINKSADINIFLIGRFLAATFSTFTIVNLYLISKKIFTKYRTIPFLVTLSTAFSPGLVQQAHFLTPESTMTYWITLSAFFLIKYSEKAKFIDVVFSAIFTGLAGGTKISSFAVIPSIMTIIFFLNMKKNGLLKNFQKVLLYLAIVFISFSFVFPYSLLDYQSFKNTTQYESSLSLGKTNIFYTRSFENSTPFLFQITKIYPYTLGITMLIFSVAGGIIVSFIMLTKKNRVTYLILGGFLFSYLIFNSILFTKWTRFVHPTFVFLTIFSFAGIYEFSNLLKNSAWKKSILRILLLILVVPTVFWGIMFFSIYRKNDVRIEASSWINQNIPKNSYILTETANMIEVPLGGNYLINPFDFYNVDTNPAMQDILIKEIFRSDYFIVQSRRVYLNHKKSSFPIVYNFYNNLFSGNLGFVEVKTFSSFPQIQIGKYLFKIDDEKAEETWTVFDHPVVRIYKKVKSYPPFYYEQLLRQ